MNGDELKCVRCDLGWRLQGEASDHEQQSLESKPCPGCGGLTLRLLRNTQDTPLRLPLSESRRQKTQSAA